MIRVVRTDSSNVDFINLVAKLDKDLAIRDGNEHAFYAQFNSISTIKHALVLHHNEMPVACGAIKEYNLECMEIKRMYVEQEYRGNGFATRILKELEIWAKELDYKSLVLETGLKQPEAIALYKKNGYQIIPNYGQYIGVENSVCFIKEL
ncbi:Acetyltransferase (GNAT) domain-containing protein [Flavobacterium sp. 9AF]|uniref:GNAT family N-acetyltransferase n=1 Tax=Flavobacterium sp. 9AF TaxID=2653142 RepID=UPI0012EF4605|nr:GNAT family N-acetyltransferase [Flavobacterium sp. 9AF]VXC16554.1 Acetyltransferase (GNAT) domain-containing protein [Flavobacterium sp. 9AF]